MFWGKNLKSNETYPLDSDKAILNANLNITNISLSDALDVGKYYIKIIDNNQSYQICSLDKNKDSISTSLTFFVKKGIKISVKGPNKGTISFVGYIEDFEEKEKENMEEINTDKIKESKKEEKKEVIPEIKKEEKKEKKEIKKEKEKEKSDE